MQGPGGQAGGCCQAHWGDAREPCCAGGPAKPLTPHPAVALGPRGCPWDVSRGRTLSTLGLFFPNSVSHRFSVRQADEDCSDTDGHAPAPPLPARQPPGVLSGQSQPVLLEDDRETPRPSSAAHQCPARPCPARPSSPCWGEPWHPVAPHGTCREPSTVSRLGPPTFSSQPRHPWPPGEVKLLDDTP